MKKQYRRVFRYMREHSKSFQQIYRRLRWSFKKHTIRDISPIDQSKLSRQEIYDMNVKIHGIGDIGKQKDAVIIRFMAMPEYRNGENTVVISNSVMINKYLERNDRLTEETQDLRFINGKGCGFTLIFGMQAHLDKGNLFKMRENGQDGGISTLAHEFWHMFTNDKGESKQWRFSEGDRKRAEEAGVIPNESALVEETDAVIFQNKVAKEIQESTGKQTEHRKSY